MMTIEQFRKLSLDDYQVTNFYDEAENLINRIKAKRGLSENTIDVSYNDTIFTFPLLTQQRETTEIMKNWLSLIRRKPKKRATKSQSHQEVCVKRT